jgi:hypothetical protein
MIMIMDNGKTNPLGQLEYGAVMRHRNPLLCTNETTHSCRKDKQSMGHLHEILNI